MPKYKLWFGISVIVALMALSGAWLYNKNSFDILNLSAGPTIDSPQISTDKQDITAKSTEVNVPKATARSETSQTPSATAPVKAIGAPLTPPVTPQPDPKLTPLAATLQTKASFFAERFGTYSSARPYDNVVGLKDYTTDNYWQFLFDKASQAKPSSPVVGYIAKVVGTQVVSLVESAGTAEINVPLVRQSFSGSAYDVGQLYSLLIKFKKINNTWLIDGAFWN